MKDITLIIIGHGSKSKNAIDDFNFVVDAVAQKNKYKLVLGAHMEIARPSLQDAVELAYKKGERNFIVFPYFLFNGMHIRYDVPKMITDLEQKYDGCTITFTAPIGQDPLMADLITKRVDNIEI